MSFDMKKNNKQDLINKLEEIVDKVVKENQPLIEQNKYYDDIEKARNEAYAKKMAEDPRNKPGFGFKKTWAFAKGGAQLAGAVGKTLAGGLLGAISKK